MKEYTFGYENNKMFNENGALSEFKKFVAMVKELDEEPKEKAWYLYLNKNKWQIVADSVKHNHSKGKLISKSE